MERENCACRDCARPGARKSAAAPRNKAKAKFFIKFVLPFSSLYLQTRAPLIRVLDQVGYKLLVANEPALALPALTTHLSDDASLSTAVAPKCQRTAPNGIGIAQLSPPVQSVAALGVH